MTNQVTHQDQSVTYNHPLFYAAGFHSIIISRMDNKELIIHHVLAGNVWLTISDVWQVLEKKWDQWIWFKLKSALGGVYWFLLILILVLFCSHSLEAAFFRGHYVIIKATQKPRISKLQGRRGRLQWKVPWLHITVLIWIHYHLIWDKNIGTLII